MQDHTSAFYKRVGALGAATALAVSGAFIASPAIASPTGEPDTASTDAPVTTATEAPASEPAVDETVTEEAPEEAVTDEAEATEEAGTVDPGLAEALLRDLGMTVEEFEAAGELGKKAADALPGLQATEGFVGIAIEDGKIVITGSGDALEALALELDATLVAPAEEAEVVEALLKMPPLRKPPKLRAPRQPRPPRKPPLRRSACQATTALKFPKSGQSTSPALAWRDCSPSS
ncbi:hypothetical protein OL239_01515 [Arthrobacter sp. ATA002]|uniref:hypothetical protein n=1 Tax=Arthrobacter sp. ATA002 TaxID=2991715 RepID=UPI0022A7E747|nr:hypothetical protein [Arthrobacter sp. ATA002]WAP52033.1 hypothetical protein OL239_01515 [Arthrobacter sp. ATA002]